MQYLPPLMQVPCLIDSSGSTGMSSQMRFMSNCWFFFQDIVEHLVENSATFKERTQFSQAKYKNKKLKK